MKNTEKEGTVSRNQQKANKALSQAKKRLKDGCYGLSLQQRGSRLYLRGQLPPSPTSGHSKPHQQEIATKFYANPAGIKQAENLAKLVAAEIANGIFQWKKYRDIESIEERRTNADWISVRKAEFMGEELTKKKEASWKHVPWMYLKQLSQDAEPSADEIIKLIKSTEPKTSSREHICTQMQAYVNCIKRHTQDIDFSKIDFKRLKTKSKRKPRHLPSDEKMVETYESISDPQWQTVYGEGMTFGLRPHEHFYVDRTPLLEGKTYINILDGAKTEPRKALALYEDWIDEFNLRDAPRPKVIEDFQRKYLENPKKVIADTDNTKLGAKVGRAFKKFNISHSGYDLRHAWVRRSIDYGIPEREGAMSLGHSVDVHRVIYTKWISVADFQRKMDALRSRIEKPVAPKRPKKIDKDL